MATIAEEISALRERISEAYDVINQKGGDVPFERTSWNLSASIDSIRTGGEPEDVNGISSLYAVQPELQSNGTFTGTQRTGPYHADLSYLTTISGYATSPCSLFGRPGYWTYSDLSTYANVDVYKNLTPNVSSVNLHNTNDIKTDYALYGMFCGNLNVLSVDGPRPTTLTNQYSIAGFARATRLPCDFPDLTSIQTGATYAFSYAFYSAQPKYNELMTNDTPERYFPNLKSTQAPYALQMVFGFYRPHHNKRLEFTELTTIGGQYAFSYACNGSEFQEVAFPKLSSISYATATSGSYTFDRLCTNCPELSSVQFPELTGIYNSSTFQYAFERCPKLTHLEFPKLKVIGTNTNGNYYGSGIFYAACQNSLALSSVSFPELTSINTNGTNDFYNFMGSNNVMPSGQAAAAPTCHCYFPKLQTWRFNASSSTFANMNNQGTASYRRKYAVHIGEQAPARSVSVGTTAANAMFYNSRGLTNVYLHSISAITGTAMFNNCYELTAIHFKGDYENDIKASNGWSTLWGRGAGASTVYFDL